MIDYAQKEQDFLSRVAKALGRQSPQKKTPKREAVGPPQFWREMNLTRDEMLERFKNTLEGLTGRVQVVKTPGEVQNQLKTWFQELNARSIIAWNHNQIKEVAKPETLGFDFRYWDPQGDRRELINYAEKADVGLTWADFAVAYTGSLAVFADSNQGRTVSLLPANHVAVFRRSNLVPTMSIVVEEMVRRRGENNLASNVTFITGPSRTSDIEMDLSIGVHGPFKVWTIILDD